MLITQRTVRWALLTVALLSLAPLAVRAQGVRVKLPAWPDLILLDTMRSEHPVSAPPEAVYAAVLKIFFELGIPVGNTDNKAGIIGSERFERSRNLAGLPMSRSFSCGESATGPNADSYRLTIVVVAWVTPRAGGGSTLATAMAASGADNAGVSKPPRECASLGRIEEKILDGVTKYAK